MVLNASALDIIAQPKFNLTVQATLSGVSSSFTQASVVITLTPVSTNPIVLPQQLTVPERSLPGVILGTLNYTSRLPQNVSWTVGLDTSGGMFNIDGQTGIVSVAFNNSGVLNFFGAINVYSLSVTATDALSASI